MKIGMTDPLRIELKPETEEERTFLQAALDQRRESRGRDLIYWGDSDEFNGAFIINGHHTPAMSVWARLRQRFARRDASESPVA